MDWLNIIDVEQALYNCRVDIVGDWQGDPWDWPEFDWAATDRPELLAERLNESGVDRPLKLDAIEESFGIRPAMVIAPMDRLAYQALVNCLSRTLIGSVPTMAYGWRLPPASP